MERKKFGQRRCVSCFKALIVGFLRGMRVHPVEFSRFPVQKNCPGQYQMVGKDHQALILSNTGLLSTNPANKVFHKSDCATKKLGLIFLNS